ncbi:hypothetical protein ABZ667_42855 [Streptomyces lavendulae]|uniref:hypothetical protein n=1 Tax=Streptomyces lavendulae TaxID=1914 RepID=UPI0033CEB7D4
MSELRTRLLIGWVVAMNRLELEPLHVGSLTGEVCDSEDSVSVVLRGDADARETGAALNEFLVRKVHPAILRAGFKRIQLDVTGVEFLNSSGIKALTEWLLAIKRQQPQDRYFIVLRYDEGVAWQNKGLKPLSYVAPSFLRLEPLR